MPYAYRGTTLFGSFRTLLLNLVTKVTRQNKRKIIIFPPRFTTPRQVQSLIGLRCTTPQLSIPNEELLLLLFIAFQKLYLNIFIISITIRTPSNFVNNFFRIVF